MWPVLQVEVLFGYSLSANQPMSNKQWLKRNSIITGATAQKNIGLVTCCRAQWSETKQQQDRHRSLGWWGSSWQNTEGICQHLKLILYTLQASLDLQRVVQYLHTAGVWIKPHWEGAFDTGHVPPGQTYMKRPEKKKVRPEEFKGEVIFELSMIVLQLLCLRLRNPNISLGCRKLPFNWI